MNFSEFILAHDGDDLARLALSRGRFSAEVEDFDLALTTLEVRRKLRDKVPEWFAAASLRYPLRVSGEQCSSTVTARYKAAVAAASSTESASVVRGGRIADLTGGLGVDSWAFSQVFDEVLYNEMNPSLAEAAAHNFRELGVNNIKVRNCALVPGIQPPFPVSSPASSPDEATVSQILCSFRPDILFLDPARRASDGRKVFRLEDCQPDVLGLLPELLSACPHVLLKLSPMADITLICKQLVCVKAAHVVAADGECKELLLLLEKGWSGPYSLTVFENGATMQVDQVQGTESVPERPDLAAGQFLFEPGKALLKAGAFDLPCRFGLAKIGRHTHLFTGGEIPQALRPFGKCFRILEVLPMDKRTLKAIGKKYPQAEVTARNVPLTSDQLRARLGVRSGGSVHVFGVHQDTPDRNLLIVTGA